MQRFTRQPNKVAAFLASEAGTRFKKLAGMLGSNGDGERANAASLATRLLRDADLTWGEVMGAGTANGAQRPSDGGQATRIRDLETRLKMSEAFCTAQGTRASAAEAQLRRAKTEIGKLRNELEVARREVQAAKAAFELAGTSHAQARDFFKKAEAAPGLKAGKPKDYATDFQRQINDLIDEIENAVELNDWEQGFLNSIRDLKYRITEKQWKKLQALAEQAGADASKVDPL